MKKKLKEIALLTGGEVDGDGEVAVENIRGIDEAGEGDLTFIANPQYRKKLAATRAGGVLAAPGTASEGKNLVIVPDPYIALGKLLAIFYPRPLEPAGISSRACIEEGASVSDKALVYPAAYVGRGASVAAGAVLYPGVYVGPDASIGEDARLYPHVCVYSGCVIGKRVILHAGVVIGSDGFGFARPGVENFKIPQVGSVRIDDDVEIGANTTVDRGTLGVTWIKRGVKIDNLVQIGHNVVIGENSVIVAQVGISGSTRLGKGVIIGGQTGLAGHIRIGDNVKIGAKSGVHEDVPANAVVSGMPHMPHKEWLRVVSSLSRLPEMRRTWMSMAKETGKREKERKTKK